MSNKKKNLRGIGTFLILAFMIVISFLIMNDVKPGKSYIYSDIINKFKNFEVTEYSLNLASGETKLKLQNDQEINYWVPNVKLFYHDIEQYVIVYNEKHPDNLMKYNLIKGQDNSWIYNLFSALPLILLIVFLFFLLFFRKNSFINDSGIYMRLDKKKINDPNKNGKKTTFKDVAGADEEKFELAEIVNFLKNPKKFKKLGARIPKGVLLIGSPGTGKTLLARAVAGEAEVPFISVSGSDFVEMYVGVGASRVRGLFDLAKKNSPCIIFIDEIDAVGRQRGLGSGGGSDEREQTLNQILVEMDGFTENNGIIVIAATNRPDILDHAFLRPGRFDRSIVMNYPDVKGREEILYVHAKGKSFSSDVKLKIIAQQTAGFTGADLESLLNESALLAARRNLESITMKEIEESIVKVAVGTEKHSLVISEKEKKLTAVHEAGHAIMNYFCKNLDKVYEVSIVPRGTAGGYTMSLSEKDEYYTSKNKMLESITVALSGRVAEELFLDDISNGASNDIEKATETVRSMVLKYGMSKELGMIAYLHRSQDSYFERGESYIEMCSDNTLIKIDEEINRIINQCYEKSKKTLLDNKEKLNKIVDYLMINEKIDANTFETLMKENEEA